MEKTLKEKTEKKGISRKIMFAWPTKTVSIGFAGVLFTYVTYFATDYLGLSISTVGMLFMVSKIFDGFTDFVAGYIIDRTHTKFGKARPYELALIGYWGSLVLLFSAPQLGVNASYVYLFVMYTIYNSVFSTLLTCNDPVYLANALERPEDNVTLLAFNGLVTLLASIIASILIPQMIVNMGTTREGWSRIAIILAIPMTLLGLMRFFLVKERKDSSSGSSVSLKQAFQALFRNKYILLVCILLLVANIGVNIGSATYYYDNVMNDLGIASLMSLSMLLIPVVLALMPKLSEKYGVIRILKTFVWLGLFGALLPLISLDSVPLVFISGALKNLSTMPLFMFASNLIIDCFDYGEWKCGVRAEGTTSCVSGIASKIGTAVGTGLFGVIMGIVGYDGSLAVQSQSAINMIVVLNTIAPAVVYGIMLVIFHFYDLDKKIESIRSELAERKINRESQV